ncbi:hypothetical protein IRY55_05110 [Savagea sp. SN6]|uniref:DUF697 domain-containing protein n=1 Tax=Savagea serpentis TaxID=2785297 RepID=A0A8J7GKU9_9BACL|nr:hypothetical protein [Savagea serpentis]MBF4500738.1 hypothetical protein [Savagea serpentis]
MQKLKILVIGQHIEAVYERFAALDGERFAMTILQGYTDESTYESFSKRVMQYSEEKEYVIVYTIQSNEPWKDIDAQTLQFLRSRGKQVLVLQVGQASISSSQQEQWATEQIEYVHVETIDSLNAFVHQLGERQIQFAKLEEVKEEVEKSIRRHVGIAFAVGFTPIPFADGPILLANQAKMLSKAMQRYELGSLTRQIQTIVGALGLGQVVSQFGRYAVSQVAKLIPGVGTVAGGVINGAVASAITTALGLTISELSYRVKREMILDPDVSKKELIDRIFTKQEAKRLFDQYLKKEQQS